MLVTILFGLWLMLARFILSLINKSVVRVLWENLLLGFGIAAFGLCRMLSRRPEEIAIADSIVTALASLTLLNPNAPHERHLLQDVSSEARPSIEVLRHPSGSSTLLLRSGVLSPRRSQSF
jgi:hypothetical protein